MHVYDHRFTIYFLVSGPVSEVFVHALCGSRFTLLHQCFGFLDFIICQGDNVTWHICILQYRF